MFPLIPDAFSSLVPYLFPLLRVWAYHQLHLLITSHQYIVISSPETRAAKDDILSLALVPSVGTFFPTVFQGFRLSPRRFSSRSRSSILSLVSLFSSGFSQTFELQFESYGRNDEPIKRVVRELSETPSEHQSFPWANQSGVDQEWRVKFPRELPNALLPKRQMAETGRKDQSKIFGQELWAADNETLAFNCQVR